MNGWHPDASETRLYEATVQLIIPHPLQKLDIGLGIVVLCGLINYALGKVAVVSGRKQKSVVLESAGKHLITDGYASLAIIIGLALLLIVQSIPATHDKYLWIDSGVALIFAMVILITGYRVLRRSISGIMDEVDLRLLNEVVTLLQTKREQHWVDLHNLRVIQYGAMLHVDAHITLPWYYDVTASCKEVDNLESLIKEHFGNQVELFIHVDPCMDTQCSLCSVDKCSHRKNNFVKQLSWKVENLWTDQPHQLV